MNTNINQIQVNSNPKTASVSTVKPKVALNNNAPISHADTKDLSFKGIPFFTPVNHFRTKEDKQKFTEIKSMLSSPDAAALEKLLTTGKLLNTESNDNSSTLDNLYKIVKEPRVQGLDNKKILAETIRTIANPFLITQSFGVLPENVKKEVMTSEAEQLKNGIGLNSSQNGVKPVKYEELDVTASGTCVSASVEFNLADKKPAEYVRFVAGLTSPDLSVKTIINNTDISDNMLDTVNILNKFRVDYKFKDWDSIEVNLKPDRNAIVRARVQQSEQKASGSRSSIDSLMQSTFMQLGSEGTYNSLNDKRYGEFNSNDKGLTEFEKNLTESIIDNNGAKTSVTYQNVDDNAVLTGYNYDFSVVQKHLLETLAAGSNIIIGITEVDDAKKIIGGHEITVINSKVDKKGELSFICNDTDDDYSGAVEIKAKDLLPKIHHAGIPIKILNPPKEEPYGYFLLKEYEKSKKESVKA